MRIWETKGKRGSKCSLQLRHVLLRRKKQVEGWTKKCFLFNVTELQFFHFSSQQIGSFRKRGGKSWSLKRNEKIQLTFCNTEQLEITPFQLLVEFPQQLFLNKFFSLNLLHFFTLQKFGWKQSNLLFDKEDGKCCWAVENSSTIKR